MGGEEKEKVNVTKWFSRRSLGSRSKIITTKQNTNTGEGIHQVVF